MSDQQTPTIKHELYGLYQDGKMKRYSLLWAVNGGAFAILKFSLERWNPTAQGPSAGPAGTSWMDNALLLDQIPWGMVMFTLLMFLDIWKFGWTMRGQAGLESSAFQGVGQFVLIMISALILTCWTMVGLSQQALIGPRMLAGPAILLFWIGLVVALGLLSEPRFRQVLHRKPARAG
jgi:hypothetical protein